MAPNSLFSVSDQHSAQNRINWSEQSVYSCSSHWEKGKGSPVPSETTCTVLQIIFYPTRLCSAQARWIENHLHLDYH